MSLNFGKSHQMLHASPTDTLRLLHPLFEEKKVEVSLLRLDQIHTEVSGNKFFKLKYNLEEAKKQGKTTILTFGGAYSNHIYATASAAAAEGFKSIGIIRGEDLDAKNPTLLHAKRNGMHLQFSSREDYRNKTSEEYLDQLRTVFGDFYLIPEGGTNSFAIQGASEILSQSHLDFTHICTAIGTGGTFTGLAKSLQPHQNLLGFSSLKGEFIRAEIAQLLKNNGVDEKVSTEIFTEFHVGGYAKWSPDLIEFIHWFWEEFNIALDPIYTGKMVYGCWKLLEKSHFSPYSKILWIHTGGLQGNVGFAQRTGIALPTP